MIVNGFQFLQPDLCSVGAQACFAEKGQVCPGPVATDNRSRGASCQISRINLVRNQPRFANKVSMCCSSLATTKLNFTKKESTHFVVFAYHAPLPDQVSRVTSIPIRHPSTLWRLPGLPAFKTWAKGELFHLRPTHSLQFV